MEAKIQSLLEILTRVSKRKTTQRDCFLTNDITSFFFRGSFRPLIFQAANLIMGDGYLLTICKLGRTVLFLQSLGFALVHRLARREIQFSNPLN